MEKIVIVGAGGHAREVLCLIEEVNRVRAEYEVVGFVDDRAELVGSKLGRLPVVGTIAELERGGFASRFVLGVGSPISKRNIANRLIQAGLSAPTLIHPSVVTSDSVAFGDGVIVCAGAVLTCDLIIGRYVTVNVACTLSHDVTIGDFATLAPGVNISGNVAIGSGCDIGTGTATVQGCSVGEWTIVGAGAVVANDLPANCTAIGVPARPIKQREPGWHLV